MVLRVLICLLSLGSVTCLYCQDTIRWMTITEMESAFAKAPKKVLIDFWAEWCTACKRMDKHAFQDPAVIEMLNKHYYTVKMNAESADTVTFGGKVFVNQSGQSRKRYYHELAVLLGSSEEGQFTLPAILIFDEQFERLARYDAYMSSKKLIEALADHSE